jgi:hypothetical protein
VDFLANERLEVDEVFVEADPENAGDVVTGVMGVIAVDAAGPKSAEAHLAGSLCDELICDFVTGIAMKILIDFVSWPRVATLHEAGIVTATPRAAPFIVRRLKHSHAIGWSSASRFHHSLGSSAVAL